MENNNNNKTMNMETNIDMALYMKFVNDNNLFGALKHINQMLKEFKQSGSDIVYTAKLMKRTLKEIKKRFANINVKTLEIVKISVIEKLPTNMCYWNTKFMKEYYNQDVMFGFSITSCECGSNIGTELHAVNVLPDGSYVDYTKDWNNEKYKYFVPLPEYTYDDFQQSMRLHKVGLCERITEICSKSKCKCCNYISWFQNELTCASVDILMNKIEENYCTENLEINRKIIIMK